MKHIAFFIIVGLLYLPKSANSSAWLQPKKHGFSSNGFYLVPKSEFEEQVYFQNKFSDFMELKSESKLEKKGFSSYAEYGFFKNITGALKINIEDIQDTLTVDVNYNDRDKMSVSQTQKYFKATNEIELRTKLYQKHTIMSSISGFYSMGDFMWNAQKYKRIKEGEYAGISINVGSSGKFLRHDYFTDSQLKLRQYTRSNKQSYLIYNTFGIYAKKKIMLQTGMYNNFNINNSTERFISTDVYDQLISYNGASKELKNAAKKYLRDEVLVKNSKDSYHQLTFKVSYGITDEILINAESFHNIFTRDAFKENVYQISVTEKF